MRDFVGEKIDSGYVIYDPKRDRYYAANTGIFKTRRNAQKWWTSLRILKTVKLSR